MILVDTNIWIKHLRETNKLLSKHLEERKVYTHNLIIGELLCGSFTDRKKFFYYLSHLPKIKEATFQEVKALLEFDKLYGKGVGWIDLNLLATALINDAFLWTDDLKLAAIARKKGLLYNNTSINE